MWAAWTRMCIADTANGPAGCVKINKGAEAPAKVLLPCGVLHGHINVSWDWPRRSWDELEMRFLILPFFNFGGSALNWPRSEGAELPPAPSSFTRRELFCGHSSSSTASCWHLLPLDPCGRAWLIFEAYWSATFTTGRSIIMTLYLNPICWPTCSKT